MSHLLLLPSPQRPSDIYAPELTAVPLNSRCCAASQSPIRPVMAADDNDQRISDLLVHIRGEIIDEHSFDGQLYSDLVRGEEENVINLCQEASDKALHILTPHNDTVLHIASSYSQESLLRRLLEECLPTDFHSKISRRNHLGNIILHEVVISKQSDSMAMIMLGKLEPEKEQELLTMRNKLEETALFCAAACSRSIFYSLYRKILGVNRKIFLQRYDKSTALHMSIINQRFDTLVWRVLNTSGQKLPPRAGFLSLNNVEANLQRVFLLPSTIQSRSS